MLAVAGLLGAVIGALVLGTAEYWYIRKQIMGDHEKPEVRRAVPKD